MRTGAEVCNSWATQSANLHQERVARVGHIGHRIWLWLMRGFHRRRRPCPVEQRTARKTLLLFRYRADNPGISWKRNTLEAPQIHCSAARCQQQDFRWDSCGDHVPSFSIVFARPKTLTSATFPLPRHHHGPFQGLTIVPVAPVAPPALFARVSADNS